jgi:hypothetical protein
MQVDRRRGELAIIIVLLAIAVFFAWGAWRMPAASLGVPGPGTVPLIVGGLLVLTTLALLVKALMARAVEADAVREMRIVPVATIFAALTGVAVAFELGGFIVTMSVFMFIMLRVFSRLGTLRSALAAVAITLVANWSFVSLLGVTLPRW